jgi:hypothetical protein
MINASYTFPGDIHRLIQLEYFCRGAVAMNSDNLDWSSDDIAVTIYTDTAFLTKVVAMFGEPDTIKTRLGETLSFIQLCARSI